MKIHNIVFNWFGTESGDEFHTYTVGQSNVTNITEHLPQFEGDRLYYNVEFEDGSMDRFFNVNSVKFIKS